MSSGTLKGIAAVVAVIAAIALLRFKPWQQADNTPPQPPPGETAAINPNGTAGTLPDDGRERLKVGFLPVT
jgi:hypothetical protein